MRERDFEKYAEKLREAGLKLTPQRIEIFREIAGRKDHPDAASIYDSVRKRMPAISLDTVYRTLWMLKESGLITTLGPSHDRMRFDANIAQHHHFVCTNCGKTEDFFYEEFNVLNVPDVTERLGSVMQSQVELRGICKQCSESQSTSPSPVLHHSNR